MNEKTLEFTKQYMSQYHTFKIIEFIFFSDNILIFRLSKISWTVGHMKITTISMYELCTKRHLFDK